MKLDDCVLEVREVVMKPPILNVPDRKWEDANDRQVIPEAIYRFYCLADFFSIDKAPKFLNDPDRFLFSFLNALLLGIRDAFDESDRLVEQLYADHELVYSPVKEKKGEKWDPEAAKRKQHSFRYLIVNISALLDQFSEVVSIFFHGDIKGITVGRSSFRNLKLLTRSKFKPMGSIIKPKEAKFQQIHSILVEELNSTGYDEQWIELLYLYRNKLTHLGSQMFPIFSCHDSEGNYYSFLPKKWPLFHQSELSIETNDEDRKSEPESMESYIKDNYIHQDILSYSTELLSRVNRLTNRCFEVLCTTYNEFKDFELNKSALHSLKEKKADCSFKCFS